MDLAIKLFMAFIGLVSVCAAVYNVLTARSYAKQSAHEANISAKVEANTVLAARTEQRVTSLESRVGSVESRIEHRIDQIHTDIGKVRELVTDYLIKH
jgi:hypothetical protein